jgi:HEAT repeat protein
LCELFTQWFVSSRLIEKIGVFSTAALLPITVGFLLPSAIALLSFFPAIQAQTVFWGLVSLKFCDELLRYTFVVSSGPVLYQPIPEEIRSWIQTLSGGTAEAISSGLTGLAIFITLFYVEQYLPRSLQKWVFVLETVIIAASCLKVVWELRSRYVDLLVLSAERGEISGANVGLRVFQQGVVKALVERGSTADKGACIELLAQMDLQGAAEVLAPLLEQLPPDIQSKSLEVMLLAGTNPAYLSAVSPLLEQSPTTFEPEVFALALRYVWLADTNADFSLLDKYLHPQYHSLIRATSAALLLRQGTTNQKLAATNTMQQMLTHPQERERINAVKAFRESVDLQALRVHIPNLLADKSLRVRCAVLEMIAATKLEEYYPTLLAALSYKSTRTTAIYSLVRLENDGLQLLLQLATNIYKPEVVRMHAWRTIAQIGTVEAQESLWLNLETSWGNTRAYILRSLIKIAQQSENNLVHSLEESRIEALIKEELRFLGEIYTAYIDLEMISSPDYHNNERLIAIGELLKNALLEVEIDVKDRLLLILKLLYSPPKIQAAALNLQSESVVSLSRGLEILDHTVKLSSKLLLLQILDRRPPQEKLQRLIENGIVEREKMPSHNEQELTIIANRLRKLLTLGNSLSDWCLACCFHFAQAAHIRLSSDQVLATLRHPTGFVREAAISYLSVVSGRVVQEILPYLQTDSHPLVAAQVQELMKKSVR